MMLNHNVYSNKNSSVILPNEEDHYGMKQCENAIKHWSYFAITLFILSILLNQMNKNNKKNFW